MESIFKLLSRTCVQHKLVLHFVMRRNIKRTLTGLDIVSFTDSSPSPVRRRIELATAQSNIESVQREDVSTGLQLAQVIDDEINPVDALNTSTSFEFHTRQLRLNSESSENDSHGSEDDETVEAQQNLRSSSYDKRKQNSVKNWENIRPLLRDVVIESECIPIGQTCSFCNTASATFRCLKCGSGQFFCEPCVASLHRNACVFHVVEQWKVSHDC